MTNEKQLKAGDFVKIESGVFAGFNGHVDSINADAQIAYVLPLMFSARPVPIPVSELSLSPPTY